MVDTSLRCLSRKVSESFQPAKEQSEKKRIIMSIVGGVSKIDGKKARLKRIALSDSGT